jgi:hypothetical protein
MGTREQRGGHTSLCSLPHPSRRLLFERLRLLGGWRIRSDLTRVRGGLRGVYKLL